MIEKMVEEIVKDFKKNPRNKVFVTWDVLIESAKEELSKPIDPKKLKLAFSKIIKGKASSKQEELYDAAISVVGNVAAKCFFNGDYDATYSYCLLETDDGFNVEIRP